jgi:hypothetical protein
MTSALLSALLVASMSTGVSIWTVGCSTRWREDAKATLRQWFGANVDDDEVTEDARRDAAHLWFGIAAAAWLVVAWLYFRGGA